MVLYSGSPKNSVYIQKSEVLLPKIMPKGDLKGQEGQESPEAANKPFTVEEESGAAGFAQAVLPLRLSRPL